MSDQITSQPPLSRSLGVAPEVPQAPSVQQSPPSAYLACVAVSLGSIMMMAAFTLLFAGMAPLGLILGVPSIALLFLGYHEAVICDKRLKGKS